MTPEREKRYRDVIRYRQNTLTLVLENIWDPHNVSAILRSADSVGILELYLVYNNQEFPKLGKKSSAGSKKWIQTHLFCDIKTCYHALRAKGFTILATHLNEASKSLYSLDLTQKTALVFGNEHSGVSDEAHLLADGNFEIPQTGFTQSLNVSVAAAVSMFEAFRQRKDQLECLSKQEQNKLFEKWSKL
ncbi:MAG: RNA methyltransferase [Acidobacteria bacterium]|nr:MAG: RNA methyltransferase [Acidobacteriota bacterium]